MAAPHRIANISSGEQFLCREVGEWMEECGGVCELMGLLILVPGLKMLILLLTSLT